MNPLARFFLRAKHWQIFILLMGPLALWIAIAANSGWQTIPPPRGFGTSNIESAFLWAVWVLLVFFTLAWLWATGSFLNSIVQPALRMKTGFFLFSLVVLPPSYYLYWVATFSSMPGVFFALYLLDAFTMFCDFYLLYFVSKSLVSAETGKPAGFMDYAGTFFRIWLFPIGVWKIQPRINELYEKSLSPAGGI